jgi:hypothetical protein
VEGSAVTPLLIPLGSGKCSSFGGPHDTGVGATEGLSCIDPGDLGEWWFRRLFVSPGMYDNRMGLARNLDPDALYCAMRWGYGEFSGIYGDVLKGFTRDQIRRGLILVTANGINVAMQAADWGPNPDTGRLIDMSPKALSLLKIGTDDIVSVQFIPLI